MIQIQLHPDLEAQLATEARARGLALDHYIEKIVEARSSAHEAQLAERHEAVEAMLDFSRKHSVTLADLELKSMMHEGHKY